MESVRGNGAVKWELKVHKEKCVSDFKGENSSEYTRTSKEYFSDCV